MNQEFVLAKDAKGRHYEAFAHKADKSHVSDLLEEAEQGTLGGHKPDPTERYGARVYFYEARYLIKLTKRKRTPAELKSSQCPTAS